VYAARIILQFEHVDSFRFKHALCFDRRFALTSPEYRSSSSPPVLCISSNRSTVLFAHKVKHGQETPLFPGIPIRDLSTPLDFYFPRKDPSFMAPELSLTIELSTTPASSDSIRSRGAEKNFNPPRSKFERKINVEFLCCRRRVES